MACSQGRRASAAVMPPLLVGCLGLPGWPRLRLPVLAVGGRAGCGCQRGLAVANRKVRVLPRHTRNLGHHGSVNPAADTRPQPKLRLLRGPRRRSHSCVAITAVFSSRSKTWRDRRTCRAGRRGAGTDVGHGTFQALSDAQYSRREAIFSPRNTKIATSLIRFRQFCTRSSKTASHSAMTVSPSR